VRLRLSYIIDLTQFGIILVRRRDSILIVLPIPYPRKTWAIPTEFASQLHPWHYCGSVTITTKDSTDGATTCLVWINPDT